MDRDPVIADLERYLAETDEDYIDPYERQRMIDEHNADTMDYIEFDD